MSIGQRATATAGKVGRRFATAALIAFALLCPGCGGGGGEPQPPASAQAVTVAIGEHAGLLAFSARLVLPPGAPPSQPPPQCTLQGACRGMISASAVDSRSLVVSIASALPLGPGPAECFSCASLAVPAGSLASDYQCTCLEAVSEQALELGPAFCPSTCSVVLAR